MVKNALIVLNYRDYETTSKFIENIKNYRNVDKIIIVDNYSNDGSYEKLLEYKCEKIHVIKSNKNGGYSYGNNLGIKYAIEKFNPNYIIISNPDVTFKDNTILKMMEIYNIYENVGIVAPRMIDKNNVESCWKLPKYHLDLLLSSSLVSKIIGNPYKYKKEDISSDINYVDVLSGSFFMIKASVIEEIGYMDEDVFLYCEEAIMSYKLLNKNYKNILLTTDEFVHEHSISINKSIQSRVRQHEILYNSKLVYYEKYKNINGMKLNILKCFFKIGLLEKKAIYSIKNIFKIN